MSMYVCALFTLWILEWLGEANIPPNHDMLRPDHNTGNSVPYSFRAGRAFFYVLQTRVQPFSDAIIKATLSTQLLKDAEC